MSTYFVGYSGPTKMVEERPIECRERQAPPDPVYSFSSIGARPKRDPIMNTLHYANKWARYFNVPLAWLVTLAHLESGHNPKKINMARAEKLGAWGLLQQMGDEAPYKISAIRRAYRRHKPIIDVIRRKWRGRPEDLLDPDLNVIISAWQLGRLRREFGDDFATVAAAYHQGAGAVRGRLEEGRPPVSPRLQPRGYEYVQKALTTQRQYGPALLAVHIPTLDGAISTPIHGWL